MALTKRQKDFLDFLAGFLEKKGYSPSYEEIANGLDLASLATVHKHILALESKQYLKRGFNQSRSLEIAPKYYSEQRQHRQPTAMEIPLLGKIAAGAPVEAISNPETLNFADFAGDPNTYALQVRGDSMIEDHICNGDFVLVERTAKAKDGDIVVGLMERHRHHAQTLLPGAQRQSPPATRELHNEADLCRAVGSSHPRQSPSRPKKILTAVCGAGCQPAADCPIRQLKQSPYLTFFRLQLIQRLIIMQQILIPIHS